VHWGEGVETVMFLILIQSFLFATRGTFVANFFIQNLLSLIYSVGVFGLTFSTICTLKFECESPGKE
jgi:hypothetical protein